MVFCAAGENFWTHGRSFDVFERVNCGSFCAAGEKFWRYFNPPESGSDRSGPHLTPPLFSGKRRKRGGQMKSYRTKCSAWQLPREVNLYDC